MSVVKHSNHYHLSKHPKNDNSKCIAVSNNGIKVYLNESAGNDIADIDSRMRLFKEFIEEPICDRLSHNSIDDLEYAISNLEIPSDHKIRALYKKFLDFAKDVDMIQLPEGEYDNKRYPLNYFSIAPVQLDENDHTRDAMAVFAAPNSGKTGRVLAPNLKLFNKVYPHSKIYLFGAKPLESQPYLSGIKNIIKVELSDYNVDKLMNQHESPYLNFVRDDGEPSYVVFDDIIGCLGDTKLETKILKIRDSCLLVGREARIFVANLCHNPFSGKATVPLWSYCNKIIVFPNGIQEEHLHKAYKRLSISPKVQKYISQTKPKWIMVEQFNDPRYLVTPEYVMLL